MGSLKHVLRRLKQAPLFTSIALVTLALGIGATTAIFSVVNRVLIQPLAYPQADALVGVYHTAPGITGIGDIINCSPGMYFTHREENHSFQDFGLWSSGGATITGIGDPEQPHTLFVTYGTLQAFGVQPILGRWFSQADDTPGSADTVILSYGFWQRRFGGDKSVIGRTITVDSKPHNVIGVMAAGFRFRYDPELFLPLRLDRSKTFLGSFGYQGVARLKPGVTLQQANADLARMLPIWLRAWPPAARVQPRSV
jgi:hypothetical protein